MPSFSAGKNIAMKLPERSYAQTVGFYRDVLGFDLLEQNEDGVVFAFGKMRLNLDRVPHQSQTDIWLEVCTDDTAAARQHLTKNGVTICDEVEALPPGFDGFWIAAPSDTIHLIDAKRQKEKETSYG